MKLKKLWLRLRTNAESTLWLQFEAVYANGAKERIEHPMVAKAFGVEFEQWSGSIVIHFRAGTTAKAPTIAEFTIKGEDGGTQTVTVPIRKPDVCLAFAKAGIKATQH